MPERESGILLKILEAPCTPQMGVLRCGVEKSMHDFFSALGHLLLRSLGGPVKWMGTTILALAIGAIRYYAVPYIDRLLSGETAVGLPSKKRLLGSVIFAALTWGLLFGISVVNTIYDDHKALRISNQTLKASLSAKDTEVGQLQKKLTQECSNPDRYVSEKDMAVIKADLLTLWRITPPTDRHIFLGNPQFDQETKRFRDTYLEPMFSSAGWTVHLFERSPVILKDISETVKLSHQKGIQIFSIEKSPSSEKIASGIYQAFRQTGIGNYLGTPTFLDPKDQLKRIRHGAIIWVGQRP